MQQTEVSMHEVGLGQIAPSAKGRGSGGGRTTTNSAMSSGGAASSSYSVGSVPTSVMSDDAQILENVRANLGGGDGGGKGGSGGGGKANEKADEPAVFHEHREDNDDSEDDMPDDYFDMRNKDIAPYAGLLTDDGLLLPVSLPGLRSLPDKFKAFNLNEDDDVRDIKVAETKIESEPKSEVAIGPKDGEYTNGRGGGKGESEREDIRAKAEKVEVDTIDIVSQDTGKVKVKDENVSLDPGQMEKVKDESMTASVIGVTNLTKPEPMEIDTSIVDDAITSDEKVKGNDETHTLPCGISAEMFNRKSAAHKLLSARGRLSFLQLPGLLPFAAGASDGPAQQAQQAQQQQRKKGRSSSVAEAVAASEKLRNLAVDMRHIGQPGASVPIGKLRIYKSGRTQLVLQNGSTVDVESGITAQVNQQVVLINTKEKTCNELENMVQSRLVAVPTLDDS